MLTVPEYQHPSLLNVAAISRGTRALGPGWRAVVWVQGCTLHCPGCIAPGWMQLRQEKLLDPRGLAHYLLQDEAVTGLTLSGGEPMLQAGRLADLVEAARQIRPIDVICFTGYSYEALLEDGREDFTRLFTLIDVLIDGPYQMGLNDGIGLRGSSNQRIIPLSKRLSAEALALFPRKLDIQITPDQSTIAGIPPRDFLPELKSVFKKSASTITR